MSFSSVLSIKVYFIENKETKEIRKFSVDSQVAKKYDIVADKVRNVFQDLLNKDLDLFWRGNKVNLFIFFLCLLIYRWLNLGIAASRKYILYLGHNVT